MTYAVLRRSNFVCKVTVAFFVQMLSVPVNKDNNKNAHF